MLAVIIRLQAGKLIRWSIDDDGSISYNIDRILRPWESIRVFDWGDTFR